jgi:hypothetical protein
MQFAKTVFLAAGVLGLLQLIPAYFMEGVIATWNPPAVEHPEFYYGFIGVVLVWQLVYLLIGLDPIRFRPMMLLAALAKFSIVVTFGWLYAQNRIRAQWLASAAFDGTFAVLFLVAYARTAQGRLSS